MDVGVEAEVDVVVNVTVHVDVTLKDGDVDESDVDDAAEVFEDGDGKEYDNYVRNDVDDDVDEDDGNVEREILMLLIFMM